MDRVKAYCQIINTNATPCPMHVKLHHYLNSNHFKVKPDRIINLILLKSYSYFQECLLSPTKWKPNSTRAFLVPNTLKICLSRIFSPQIMGSSHRISGINLFAMAMEHFDKRRTLISSNLVRFSTTLSILRSRNSSCTQRQAQQSK